MTTKRKCPHCHASLERYEDPVAVELLSKSAAEIEALTKERSETASAIVKNIKELADLRSQNRELIGWLQEASRFVEKIGTTGVERTDVILGAEKWLPRIKEIEK